MSNGSPSRQRVGHAEDEPTRASVTDVARTMIGDIDLAFYPAVATARRKALARDILDLDGSLAEWSLRISEAGRIKNLECNLAIVELGRSSAPALATQRGRESILVALRRRLGLQAKTPDRAAMDGVCTAAPDADSRVAPARRPDLAGRGAAVRASEARSMMARREAIPKLLIRVSSARVESSGAREVRPGVGFAIPPQSESG